MIDTNKLLYQYTGADFLQMCKESGIFASPATQNVNPFSNPATPATPVVDTSWWNPDRKFFYENQPDVYRHDPAKMAIFLSLYGPNAVAVAQQFGTVPENCQWPNVSTASQRAFFTASGKRVSYKVSDLMQMTPAEVASVTDVPLDIIQGMAHNNQWDELVPSKFK